jgi:hypothetical protein
LEVDNMKTKLYATGPEGSLATRETDRPYSNVVEAELNPGALGDFEELALVEIRHKEPELVVSDAELAGRPFEVKSGFVSMPVWRIK